MTITADEVRRIRADLDLSQAQFAARLNQIDPSLRINRQTVYRWEGGTPPRTPDAHSERAIRLAARGERPYGVIDRFALAAMIRKDGVRQVAAMVDDFAKQMTTSLTQGISFEGWSTMQSATAVVFGRRDRQPQALDPEVLALRAEKAKLEDSARRRFFDDKTIRDNVTRAERVKDANRRLGEINRRLALIDPAAIRYEIAELQRADHPDQERIDALYARFDAVADAPSPPVEGVLCINDTDPATYASQVEDAGFPLIVLMADEAGFGR